MANLQPSAAFPPLGGMTKHGVLSAKAYPASSLKIRFTWERLGILKGKEHGKRKVGVNFMKMTFYGTFMAIFRRKYP